MRLVMVNPNERLGQGKSHPLRRPQANQQRAGQAGALASPNQASMHWWWKEWPQEVVQVAAPRSGSMQMVQQLPDPRLNLVPQDEWLSWLQQPHEGPMPS